MVDFNKEGTVTQPAKNIVGILILEKKEGVILAYGEYTKAKLTGRGTKGLPLLLTRIVELYLELEGSLARKKLLKAPEIIKIQDLIIKDKRPEGEEINKIITFLTSYLDTLGLTKIDTKEVYDTTDVEQENTKKGM